MAYLLTLRLRAALDCVVSDCDRLLMHNYAGPRAQTAKSIDIVL